MSNPRGAGSAPSSNARFLVLEVPVGVSLKKRILGSAIPRSNTTNPFECYSPWLDDPSLSERDKRELERVNHTLWKEEEGASVTLSDTSLDGSHHTQTGAQTQLSDFFRASISKSKNQEVHIRAGTARRYMIDAPDNAIPTFLFNSPLWMSQLQRMYDRLGDRKYPVKDLAVVTGVWTCEGLEVSWKRDEGRDGRLGARVIPSSLAQMAVGDPGIVAKMDVALEIDHSKSNSEEVIANCKQEVLFALAYHDLFPTFKQETAESNTFWGRRKTVTKTTKTIIGAELGDPIRGDGIDAYAGDHDEEVITVSDFYYEEPRYASLNTPQTRTNTEA